MALTGCQKDLAEDWAGVYLGNSGTGNVNRVIITKIDRKTVKIELQFNYLGAYITYATAQSANLVSSTVADIKEDGEVYGSVDIYSFLGSARLNGKNLQVNVTATNRTNSSDVRPYTFVGVRQ